MAERFDVAVIGAGIVGLAHALAAARRGLRVLVIERDHQANGASIRNFGFVTVTGQAAGQVWQDARASRAIWETVAQQAAIPIAHRGLYVLAESEEAEAVLDEFAAGPMAEGCRRLSRAELDAHAAFSGTRARSALHSTTELRVEARHALPRLAAWLAERCGVTFLFDTLARAIDGERITTSRGTFLATAIFVCANLERHALYPQALAQVDMTACKLQMLRVAAPGWTLPGAIMSDLGLIRYLGYAECPSLPALRARLAREQQPSLQLGIHLIVVQSGDGTLVVGDSHENQPTPDPFASAATEALMLAHARRVLDLGTPGVIQRWIGIYPSGAQHSVVLAVEAHVRVVVITSGTGMSTAFGLAERVVAGLFGDVPRGAAALRQGAV